MTRNDYFQWSPLTPTLYNCNKWPAVRKSRSSGPETNSRDAQSDVRIALLSAALGDEKESRLRPRREGSHGCYICLERHNISEGCGFSTSLAQMILQKNIDCRWYSSVFFLWQPTGHWFSCQMGVCHWSPSVAKTDEDQRQPMFFCNIIWATKALKSN